MAGTLSGLLALCVALQAVAAPTALGFAHYLVAAGEPDLAISELERALDLDPDDDDAQNERRALFALELSTGQFEAAERDAQRMASAADPAAPIARADVDALHGRPAEALLLYEQLGRVPAWHKLAGRRILGLAVRERWWGEALDVCDGLARDPDEDAADLARLADEIRAWRDRPRPDANVARMLSVIPGVGQLYAHDPEAAAGSVAINGMLGLAALWATHQGDPIGAGLIIGNGARYYFGGIKHAGQIVDEATEHDERGFFRHLAANRPWLRLVAAPDTRWP